MKKTDISKIKLFGRIIEFNKKNWCIYAFLLAIACYFMFMSYSQVVFAKYTYIAGDHLDQYASTINMEVDCIRNGENIYYSFSHFFGHNTSGLIAYSGQMFSIIFFLCLLFPWIETSVLIFIGMLIKVGLSAMCFQMFSVTYINRNKFLCLLISLCYSLSAFQVCILKFNSIWMDAFWLLPLIIYFIHRFINNKNWIPLAVCYAYLFITNFYMGYIVGIFSFIYFVLYLAVRQKCKIKIIFGYMLKYMQSVLVAVSLSGFLLLPAAFSLLSKGVSGSGDKELYSINILDILNQMFIGTDNGYTAFFPYIYCGVICLILLPLFFVNKKIKVRTKVFYGILLIILFASCLIMPLYVFWHFFDYPDGWGNRFSFLISFVLCVIACYQLRYVKNVKPLSVFISIASFSILYIVEIFFQRKYPAKYQSNDIMYLLINIGFMTAVSLLIFSYKKYCSDAKKNKSIAALLILCISAELILNGYASYYHNESMEPNSSLILYQLWEENSDDILKRLDELNDSDMYRVEMIGDYIMNGDTYYGYYGTGDFYSTDNIAFSNTLRKMGIYTASKILLPFGYTDLTSMLLGIKYSVVHTPYNAMVYFQDRNNTIDEKESYIGIGFAVDDNLADFTFGSNNSFQNLNDLSSFLLGEKVEMFSIVSNENLEYEEIGVNLIEKQDGSKLLQYQEDFDQHRLFVYVPVSDKPAYILFSYDDDKSSYITDMPVIEGGIENYNFIYGCLSASYIKPMLIDEEQGNNYVSILMEESGIPSVVFPNAYAAYYNDEVYDRIYDKLSNNKLIVDEYRNGYVRGNITINDDNQMLFTSIPFEKGWKACVNGKEQDITPLLDGAFIGLNLDNGYNEIELEYSAPYAKLGAALSVAGLLYLIVACAINLKKNNKK